MTSTDLSGATAADVVEKAAAQAYDAPSRDAARENANANHPRDGDGAKWPLFVPIDKSGLGIGLGLYMGFLKFFGLVFLAMFCINVPAILNNFSSARLNPPSPFFLEQTTLGNLAYNSSDDSAFDSYLGPDFKRTDAALVASLSDIAASLFFLGAFLYFVRRQKNKINELDLAVQTASDYAVQIKWFSPPEGISAEGIRRHFENLGHTVMRVSIVNINGGFLSRMKTTDKCLIARDVAAAVVRKSGGKKGSKKLVKAQQALDAANDKAGGSLYGTGGAQAAYVMFNDESSVNDVCKLYPKSWVFSLRWLFQKKKIRYSSGEGGSSSTTRLLASQAKEPTDIIWENFAVSGKNRFLRRVITTSISFALLISSFSIIFGAKRYQASLGAFDTACVYEPAEGAGENQNGQQFLSLNYSKPDDEGLLRFVNKTCPLMQAPFFDCSAPRARNATALSAAALAKNETYYPGPFECDDDPTAKDLRDAADTADMQSLDGARAVVNFQKHMSDNSKKYIANGCYFCYCDSLVQSGNIGGNKLNALFCSSYLSEQSTLNGLKIVGMVGIVAVNVILKPLLFLLAKFERHGSESKLTSSIATKIGIQQFLNTAFLLLVLNANLSSWYGGRVPPEVLEQGGDYIPGTGDHADFTSDWYYFVGSQFILTVIINAVTLSGVNIVKWPVTALLRKCLWKSKPTQRQLNDLYIGPEFRLAELYGVNLSTFFVIMLYSSGMPVMYLIGFVDFFFCIYAVRVQLLRVCKTPPQLDEALAVLVNGLLPMALTAHLIFGMWMMGNLPEDTTTVDAPPEGGTSITGLGFDLPFDIMRLFRTTTLPHFVFIVLYLVANVLNRIGFGKVLGALKYFLTCRCFRKTKVSPSDSENLVTGITMAKALRDKIFRGAASYDIQDNPAYGIYLAASKTDDAEGEKMTFALPEKDWPASSN